MWMWHLTDEYATESFYGTGGWTRVNELTDSEAAFHIGQWHAVFAAFGALGFAKLGQVLQVGEAFLESHEFFVRQNSELFLAVAF